MKLFQLFAAMAFSSSLTVAIAFFPGAAVPNTSSLVIDPNTAPADGTSQLLVKFFARDSNSNAVPGVGVTFSVSGTSNNWSATSGTTDSNGLWSATLSSTSAQYKTVTASFGNSYTASAGVRFVPGPASATSSSFVISPNSTTADNSNVLVAVLTLLDAQNNPIAGVTPAFSASGVSTTVTPSGDTSPSGQASASYRTAVAQNQNAYGSAAGLNFTAPMSFLAGQPTTAASSLTANPTTAPGNGAASITLVATARDAQGNGVPAVSVTLSASGSNTTFDAASGMTLGDGTYTTGLKSTQAQAETISAVIAGNVTETVSVTFTASPNATTSTLTVSPVSQTVGSATPITATLTLKDAASHPLAGVTPTWSSSGGNTTIAPSGATSATGVATATYVSSVVQNENVQVLAAGLSLYQPVQFVAATPAHCVLAVTPNQQPADGNSSMTLTATITDNSNQPVSGAAVRFSSTGPAQNFSPLSVTTAASGQAVSHLTSLYQGSNTLMAQAANAKCSVQGSFSARTPYCTSNPNFPSTASYSASNFPYGVVAADFNGDGKLDIAMANEGSNNMGVFLGKNAGAFQSQVTYSTGTAPFSIIAGDFNGDGKPDLAVGNNTSNTISVFLNTGAGAFQAQVTYATGHGPQGLTVGDFNGDGKQDLAVANDNNNTVGIFLGTGSGTFQPQVPYATGVNPIGITTGDFNADGLQDLVVVNNSSDTIGVFLSSSAGTMQPQVTFAAGPVPSLITTGDFNGDGNQDVAVTNAGSSPTVGVFFGTGMGTFQSQIKYTASGTANTITVGDLNGDSQQDLLVGINPLKVYFGAGSGNFQSAVTYSQVATGYGLAVGDFDLDGKQDLAMSNPSNNRLEVHITSCQ